VLVEVKVPVLAESVPDATLLGWNKKAGETVAKGEILIDLETDKVTLEVAAPEGGVLKEIVKREGDTALSDEVLAVIDTDAAPSAGAAEPEPAQGPAPAASAPAGESAGEVETAAPAAAAKSGPAARKLMAEKGIQPDAVGPRGRITKHDVLEAIDRNDITMDGTGPAPIIEHSEDLGERPEERVPMTRLRRRAAERLLEAQQGAALLTTFNEVNMQPVSDLRSEYKEAFEKKHGVKLGFMAFFVKAAVEALKKFPVVNASVDGDDIVYHGFFDIGIAVSSERGLVVPILRDAEFLSFADIEHKIRDFGNRARDGKLTIDELTGGTFTITNGGIFGSMMSTPIVNPPQSAILGMHAIKERPVVENGEIVVRPMMYLALTYDHRIIDGREAVQTLVTIKDMLEDPARLLLNV